MPDTPELSVAVLVGVQRARAGNALEKLLAQSALDRIEILIFDFAPELPPLPGSEHPRVRVFAGDINTSYGAVRLEALNQARAPLMAYIEEHVIVPNDWVENLLLAFAVDESVVGISPRTLNGNPQSRVSRVLHVLQYQSFSEAQARESAVLLMGQNSSYRVSHLLKYAAMAEDIFSSEPLLNWKLAEEGHQMVIDPRVQVAHYNESQLSTIIKGTYYWHRQFAHSRTKVFGWQPLKRVLWAVATPLIPWVRLMRTLRFLAQQPNVKWGEFLLTMPAMMVVYYALAAGIFMGLAFGVGDSAQKFLAYEMNENREIDYNYWPFSANP